MSTPSARLQELGIELPQPPAAIASYVPVVRTGQLAVTSGQLPLLNGALTHTGKVGAELTEQEAALAARQCALNALAHLKRELGSLDRIERIVKLDGFVQSAPGFSRQPVVINGASDLMLEIFGEAGRHSRVAVGVNELPLNAAVEVAVWVSIFAD
jgi:enamine deaminase RidA (YjgF/YER057c/UK114 family)